MDLKRKFDHEDLSNYLPDNILLGTEQYYRKKYKNLPDYLYKILEVKTKDWYSEQDEKNVIEEAKNKILEYNDKLMKEYNDRLEEGLLDDLDKMEDLKVID